MTKPIRVLHIDSASIWGGGQSQIATLIRESRDLPIEHHLASPKNSKLWFKTRSLIKGYLPIARSSSLSPFAMLRAYVYCKKNQIQIIHAHCGRSHTFAFWLKKFMLPEIKLIVHRRIPAKVRSNLLSREKFISQSVDHFITVSEYIREVITSCGVDQSRITTIRSSKKPFPCEPSDKARARKALTRTQGLAPGGEFFIISASRLVPDKGLFILIEAFRQLVREKPDARLIIAGEGPLEDDLKSTGKALIESGHLVFPGFRKDVPELLLGADLFAIPSLSEGLGSTIVEAMMANTVVLGSNVEGIPELVHTDINGITVPPGDASALFSALYSLAIDRLKRDTLADKALRWAHDACTPKIMVDKTYEVYRRIFEVGSK